MKYDHLITEARKISNNKLVELLKKSKFGVDFDKEYNEKKVPLGDAVFMNDRGIICISGEHEHTAGYVIDYYGEYRGGYPYISDEIEAFAKKHGKYWEWENPGVIALAD